MERGRIKKQRVFSKIKHGMNGRANPKKK